VLSRIRNRLLRRLAIAMDGLRDDIGAELMPRFANVPARLYVGAPRTIVNPERIFIGDDVWLGPNTQLIAMTTYPGSEICPPHRPHRLQSFESRLTIGDRVTATSALQVTAHLAVTIEDDVLFAANVFIADATHGYERADEPYKYQALGHLAPVTIKRGCWIGQNVVVLPGVTIGEFCVIGANCVVTQDVPARSIAVGAPARVVKSWDETSRQWIGVVPPARRDLR
jgi:acetyltransferase-like isoleucine patch superfamily enzyme